jgi:hypothetical protein
LHASYRPEFGVQADRSFLLRLLPGGVDEEPELKSHVYCIPY